MNMATRNVSMEELFRAVRRSPSERDLSAAPQNTAQDVRMINK